MRRREFVTALGGAAAAGWPLAARAQQDGRVRRIGVLINLDADDPVRRSLVAALRQGLRDLQWDEGKNIRIDVRGSSVGLGPSRTRAFAAELASLSPDLIVADGPGEVDAVQQANRVIPIVFTRISEPVGLGYVESLARPGGNMTGFTLFENSVTVKLLEAIKEFAPGVARAALLMSATNPTLPRHWRALETAAHALGIQPITVDARNPDEIDRTITTLAGEPKGALIAPPSNSVTTHRELIVALAAHHRVPAAYGERELVISGGLMSYGPDGADNYRRAASYVDRILRGAKPADLPVQQPTKFDFVLNLKTARALGLEVPTATLLRATEVIE